MDQSHSPELNGAVKRRRHSHDAGDASETASSVPDWSEARVLAWLDTLGLSQYSTMFRKHSIDGAALMRLDRTELQQLDIDSIGHRTRLMLSIEQLRKSNGLPAVASHRTRKIAIEGNIAAGKSTFLQMLAENMDFVVVPEPVSKWQNVASPDDDTVSSSQVSGGNLLQMFYDEPARWGYTFQTYAFLSRMRVQMQPTAAFASTSSSRNARSSPHVQFFERSVYSDRYCFASNCHDSGIFNDVEWHTYCDWHTWLLESFAALRLDGMVYLRTKPETCFERLKRRARPEEKSVPLEYLRAIHNKHEAWLLDKVHRDPVAQSVAGIPLLVIDTDDEFERDPSRAAAMKNMVDAFVASLDCK